MIAPPIIAAAIPFAKDIGKAIGKLGDDYMSAGENRYQVGTYTPGDLQYGGRYGADNIADVGFKQIGQNKANAGWAQGEAQANRGPQAWENQELSDRESMTRGYDQAGALQLSREAAMGLAPSEAEMMMRRGLDQARSAQAGMAGGARGAAGIAMAGANANAASANLQNQYNTAAGQMRANEMATARGMYGSLSGQMRDQDLQRLNMGNQMSQYNAGLNDQYRMGMGQLSNQYNQSGQGWYTAAQNPYNQQGSMDVNREQIGAQSYNQAQAVAAGQAQANADNKRANRDALINIGAQALQVGGGIANSVPGKK